MRKHNPSIYLTGSYVCIDFETTILEYGSPYNIQNNIVLACWFTSWDNKWHSKWGNECEMQELLRDVQQADFIIAQNAKFELGWLDRCGIDLHDILCFDTMLAEWVLQGNKKESKHLGDMLKRYGFKGKDDVVNGMIKLGISPSNIPRALLESYCFEDVRGTLELFLTQRELLDKRQQMHLAYSRCLLTPVLVDMEKQGVCLDRTEVEKEYVKVQQEYQDAKQSLQAYDPEVNFDSPQQVAALIYDRLGFEEAKDFRGDVIKTDGGDRSTAGPVLLRLRARNKTQTEFLRAYREFSNAGSKLSKTLNFYKEVVENHDGIFYGIFNQGIAGTHRLTSSGRPILALDSELGKENGRTVKAKSYSMQLQNPPREYKRLVVAKRPGWKIVEADGSQIEFRVAADMGHDKIALDEIANYADIHSMTAKAITDAGQPTTRQEAKVFTFKPLYGGTSGTEAEQAYYKFFQDKYSSMYKTQTGWTHEVLKTKELRTPYGMIFYWPDTKVTRSGFITNTTSIFNYPVQNFATGEIIPIVLHSLWQRLRGWQVAFILTLHDSIVLEIGPDVDEAALKEQIALAFTEDVYNYLEAVYGYTFKVPLGCEIKIGERWGAGKGIKAHMFNKDRILHWRE